MTDIPTPPASMPPPTDPAPSTESPRRGHSILGRLSRAVREQNWFAVGLEVLIVITGVVVGFQVTAWGQARTDRAREQTYLGQLVADLAETERVMAERDASMDSLTHHAVDHLILSFGHQPRPPRDSVETWLLNANYVASPRPALGTIEALVASGDFGAIRNDSLRSAILRYLDTTRENVADLDVYISRAHEQRQRLQSHFRYGGVWDATYDMRDTDVLGWSGDAVADTTGRAASPDWVYPFPFDVMTLYDDPEVLDTLMRYGDMLLELQKQRTVFRESAAALREQVEAEITP